METEYIMQIYKNETGRCITKKFKKEATFEKISQKMIESGKYFALDLFLYKNQTSRFYKMIEYKKGIGINCYQN